MSGPIKDGGPAFPVTGHLDEQGMDSYWTQHPSEGMTLRDYFAAKALANVYTADEASPNRVAEWAYHIADAMIAAREVQ